MACIASGSRATYASPWPLGLPPRAPASISIVSWAALLARTGLTDGQEPSLQWCPVERRDGHVGFGRIGHVHERKAAGSPGLPLRRDLDAIDDAVRFEEQCEVLFRGGKRDVPDKNTHGSSSWLVVLCAINSDISATFHPSEQPIAQHSLARIDQAPVHAQQVSDLRRREACGMVLEQGHNAPAHRASDVAADGLWRLRGGWLGEGGRGAPGGPRGSWSILGAGRWGTRGIEEPVIAVLHLLEHLEQE